MYLHLSLTDFGEGLRQEANYLLFFFFIFAVFALSVTISMTGVLG